MIYIIKPTFWIIESNDKTIISGNRKTTILITFSTVPMIAGISFQKKFRSYPLGNDFAKRIFHAKIGINSKKQFQTYSIIFLFTIKKA